MLSKLSGHTDAVRCVAAADNGHVLTGSRDKTVKVWRGDELVRTIEAHTESVSYTHLTLPTICSV